MNRQLARTTAALLTASSLALTGCAGSVGQRSSGGGVGFEYGASQEEVNAVVAELEPTVLTYQPAANSPNALEAPSAQAFKDYIEQRSNGKIEVNLVYGQAIAGYDELDDALSDGRVDIAFHVPVYQPSTYRAYNAISTALHGLPSSPLAGDVIYNAVAENVAWNSEELLQEYENLGLTPLIPMMGAGAYNPICTTPINSLEDWQGRQVRIASTAHLAAVESVGASPVSMAYVETYEGLQRGTVDCTVAQNQPSAAGGIFEVASHVGYFKDEYSLSSRTSPALLAGSRFKNLPLAYQQIIFDGAAISSAAWVNDIVNSNREAVVQIKENGGSITELDEDVQKLMSQSQHDQLQTLIDDGRINESIIEEVDQATQKWTAVAAEHGIEDSGTLENFDEWWTEGSIDFEPFSRQVFEEAALEHRPS